MRLIMVLYFLSFCGFGKCQSENDYLIYDQLILYVKDSVVIKEHWYCDKWKKIETKNIVICNQTNARKPDNNALINSTIIKKETIDNYFEVNSSTGYLKYNFKVNLNIYLARDGELDSIFEPKGFFKQDGWTRLYKIFPQTRGYYIISKIGYNKDRTQALLYCLNHAGSLSGSGSFFIYELENNHWVLKKEIGDLIF